GLELPSGQRAAADFVEQLAERDLADLVFEVTRLLHVAADAEDARAGVVRRADLRVGVAAHLDDVLHVAERLHVVHDRRALIETEHRGKIRWLDARIRPLALERFDQARFLAADVRARAAVDVDLAAVFRAEDFRADEIRRARLRDRLFQNPRAVRHFAADINV